MRKVTELSELEIEGAKQMFMEYEHYTAIATKYDVARTSLTYHAKKWKKERDMMKAELFAQFSSTKKAHFVKMSEASITIIGRALQDLATREIPPSVREAKDATAILEAIDKITRLDDGDPTEIVAEKPASIKMIKAKLALDPFEEVEYAAYKELSESTNNSDNANNSNSRTDISEEGI